MGPTQTKGGSMTTEQKEKLREVLIDYLQLLTSTTGTTRVEYEKMHNARIAEVRLLLREVA
jgi:replicative DNA helicase